MADQMLRIAGRGSDGLAKAVKTDDNGVIEVSVKNEVGEKTKPIFGAFVEPYVDGYVGNVMVTGLEQQGKISTTISIVDVKVGTTGIYVLLSNKYLQKFDIAGNSNTPLWTYTGYTGTTVLGLAVDFEDNVIINGSSATGKRTITKVSGATGLSLWSAAQPTGNYTQSNHIATDKIGDVYSVGTGGPDRTKGLYLLKYAKATGALLWSYLTPQTLNAGDWVTIDNDGFVYYANRTTVQKLDQSLANITTPPTVVWTLTTTDSRIVKVDAGNLVYTGGTRKELKKLDQSLANASTPPVVLWTKLYTGDITGAFLDSSCNIYTNQGKLKSDGTELWGTALPATLSDLRDDYIYVTRFCLDYFNSLRYDVLKLSLDLKQKTYLGVN